MQYHMRRLSKWGWYSLVTATVVLALMVSVARYVTPLLQQYRVDLQNWLEKTLGLHVEITTMVADWQGTGPAISVKGLTLTNERQLSVIAADNLTIKLSLISFLRRGIIIPTQLYVDDLHIRLAERSDHSFTLPDWSYRGHEQQNLQPLWQFLDNLRYASIDRLRANIMTSSGEDVEIHSVRARFDQSDGRSHLNLDYAHQGTEAYEISLFAMARGSWRAPQKMLTQLYLKMKDFHLKKYPWSRALLPHFLQKGSLSAESWLDFQGASLLASQGSLQLQSIQLADTSISKQATAEVALSTNFSWQRLSAAQWQLLGDEFTVQVDGQQSEKSQFKLNFSKQMGKEEYSLRSSHFSLAGLGEVFAAVLDEEYQYIKKPLSHIQLQGQAQDLHLQLIHTPLEDNWRYSLAAQLSDVQTQSWQSLPALQGINGLLQLENTLARFEVNTENLSLVAPQWFSQPLEIGHAEGLLTWEKAATAWHVEWAAAKLVGSDIGVDMNAELRIPFADKPITLELLLQQTQSMTAQQLLKWVPLKRLPPELQSWLQQSLQAGSFDNGLFVLRGPIKDLPFDNGEGSLAAQVHFNNGKLRFNSQWPALEQVDAMVRFYGRSLQVDLNEASSAGLKVQAATVTLPAIVPDQELLLQAQGKIRADLATLKPYLQATPLWKNLADDLQYLSLAGPMQLDLDFFTSLDDKHNSLGVDGFITTEHGSLLIPKLDLAFDNIVGKIHFDEHGIAAEKIEAQFLGVPMSLDIVALRPEKGQAATLYRGKGHFTVQQLAAKYPHPLWKNFNGDTELQVEWRDYGKKAQQANQLVIQSTLEGVASTLPAPLQKKKKQKLPMHLSYQFSATQLQQSGSLADIVQTQLFFDHSQPEWLLQKGVIHFGPKAAVELPKRGLQVSGSIGSLNLQQWQQVLLPLSSASGFVDWHQQLVAAKLMVGELILADRRYENMALELQPQPETWQLSMHNKLWHGEVQFPVSAAVKQPIVADMQLCHFNSESQQGVQRPAQWPSLQLRCTETWFNDKLLGELEIASQSHADKVTVERFDLQQRRFDLHASAEWYFDGKQHQTTAAGQLNFKDISEVFKVFAINTDMTEAKGSISFTLNSSAPLLNLNLPTVEGQVSLNLRDGRMIDVDSGGIGKFISLFSFHNLQKRLRLDFSDVFKEGFAFDSLQGELILKNGIATAEKIEMDGSSAFIALSGSTDLINETLDLEMTVMPHVTGTFPLAAAVATGNPAIGAAVWVVDKILAKSTRKLASYRYKISGSWDKLDIQFQS